MSICPLTVSVPLCQCLEKQVWCSVLIYLLCGLRRQCRQCIGTHVCFHERVEIFSSKTTERWTWTAKTLCESLMAVNGCTVHEPSARDVRLGNNLAEKFLTVICWAASVIVLKGCLCSFQFCLIKCFITLRSTKKLEVYHDLNGAFAGQKWVKSICRKLRQLLHHSRAIGWARRIFDLSCLLMLASFAPRLCRHV